MGLLAHILHCLAQCGLCYDGLWQQEIVSTSLFFPVVSPLIRLGTVVFLSPVHFHPSLLSACTHGNSSHPVRAAYVVRVLEAYTS